MHTPNPERTRSAETGQQKERRIEHRKAGHGFVRPGDPFRGCYFLLKGKLSVYKEGGDAVSYADPGNCLEAQFRAIEDGLWQATIIAEEDVAVEIYGEEQIGKMFSALRARVNSLEERIARLEDEAQTNLGLIDETAEENVRLAERVTATEAERAERLAESLGLREEVAAANEERTELAEKVVSLNELVQDLFRTGSAGTAAQEWMAAVDARANELWEDFTGVADRMTSLEIELQGSRTECARRGERIIELESRRAAEEAFDAAVSSGIDELDLRGRIEAELQARFRTDLEQKDKRNAELEAEVERLHGDVEAARRLAATALGRSPESIRRMPPPPSSRGRVSTRPRPPMETLTGVPLADVSLTELDPGDEELRAEMESGRPTLMGVAPPSNRTPEPPSLDIEAEIDALIDGASTDGDRHTSPYFPDEDPTKPSVK